METPTRILVIEDNRANLDLMVYLFDAFGYTPLVAMDGLQGVEVARREHPELILCDVDLPKLDGYGVLEKLKSESDFSHVPIVAVTALAMVGDRDRILKCGFNGYLGKPITPETFIEQVENFIAPKLRAKGKPMSAAESDAPEFPIAPGLEKNAKILVVDDTAANIGFVRSTLAPSGYRVLTASNVHEAMTLVEAHELDLILSDVNMPSETGYDLWNSFRRSRAWRAFQ